MLRIISRSPSDCGLHFPFFALTSCPCKCRRRAYRFFPYIRLNGWFYIAEQPAHPLAVFQHLAFTEADFAFPFELDDGFSRLLFIDTFWKRSIDPQNSFVCGRTNAPLVDFDSTYKRNCFVDALFLFGSLTGKDVHIEFRIAQGQSDFHGVSGVRQ